MHIEEFHFFLACSTSPFIYRLPLTWAFDIVQSSCAEGKLIREGCKFEAEYNLADLFVVAGELPFVVMVVVEAGQQSVVGDD